MGLHFGMDLTDFGLGGEGVEQGSMAGAVSD